MPDAEYKDTVLIVDSDIDFLNWATKHLEAPDLRILRTDNAEKALKIIAGTEVDLVLSDIQVQPFDGLELISKIRAQNPAIVTILLAGFPSTTQIIEATRLGARDVLRKEALNFELRAVVESAFQVIESRRSAEQPEQALPVADARIKMIGQSRIIQETFKLVGRVAPSDAPVLVTGESGTGKELVAQAVHEYSPRRKNDFIAINCGAIPENLLESELFGHEKGSFTGAMARRAGRFEQGDGGTLFLDEIGDMPQSVQVKLLRVLQDGSFSRVGSNETLNSDVRIVAATNKDLAHEVAKGRFREDLYYRLNVVEIHLPPLRERREDIPLLAEFFLQRLARKYGLAKIKLSGEAIHTLQNHRWTGNVRELENTMARACALAESSLLLSDDIPFARSPWSEEGRRTKALRELMDLLPESEKDPVAWFGQLLAEEELA
ncbi:sigma-54-dependent transcriptional regulator [Roseibacillus ishigakijimensis]|uniref:DNA-binding transcriptional regulator NtrC n=1 Tax=Roseibacillus ishigakijimensis TaxID=454146 RepID=A0A934RM65_9BACT|nr:sigma-54 dependent transcriptional regulator [Roseibacillus ishigakijimensis]MBK1833939.1 sigma-54-dependent Fis family transcriptional regulator [Roseibacillus ishigakijimensis]